MYAPTIGRFISEDPIALDGDDENLYRYVKNDPVNDVDPSGLGPQWHHLLPQAEKELFEKLGFKIHDSQWGWVLDEADHQKLHGDWVDDWRTWKMTQVASGTPITKESVREQLRKMTTTKPKTDVEKAYFAKYGKYLKKGYAADINYLDWVGLGKGKAKHFRNLKRSSAALLAIFGTMLGAADDACAAFGPVTGLADDDQRRIFQEMMDAIRKEEFHRATKLAFGPDVSCNLGDENPAGIFCQWLKDYRESNPLANQRLLELEAAARKKWQDMIDNYWRINGRSEIHPCGPCATVRTI